MKNKQNYVAPQIEVLKIAGEDIITTSTIGYGEDWPNANNVNNPGSLI